MLILLLVSGNLSDDIFFVNFKKVGEILHEGVKILKTYFDQKWLINRN